MYSTQCAPPCSNGFNFLLEKDEPHNRLCLSEPGRIYHLARPITVMVFLLMVEDTTYEVQIFDI